MPEQTSGAEFPEVRLDLRKEDIHSEIPEKGGTVLVLQVNARDDRRDPKSPEFGALMPEAAEQTVNQAEKFFSGVFEKLSPEDRAKVAIIVFASDAELKMPAGTNSPHKRAAETGEKVLEGIRKSMTAHTVNGNQLLNDVNEHHGEPMGVSGLIDLEFWNRPEFVEYMREKYGDKIWKAYEGGEEAEKEVEMGAEGVIEIATRMREALTGLTVSVANEYHIEHPDSLLFLWAVSHYDSVAPWVNGYVYQADPTKLYTPTEKGGGITVKIDREGKTAETTIGGQRYEVPSLLHRPGTTQPS